MGLFRVLVVVLGVATLLEGHRSPRLGLRKKECLSEDAAPYVYHATKTRYSVARGDAPPNTDCKPVQFWSLNRHGTRYASEEDLIAMKGAEKIRTKIFEHIEDGRDVNLCKQDLELLKKWSWNDTIEDKGNYLTEQGFRESTELAQRYRQRYPQLLGADGNYNNEDFYFRHTTEQRTEQTCKAYIRGLFGDNATQVQIDEPRPNDDEIRSYDACPAWQKEVDENEDFRKAQKRLFRNGKDYLLVQENVSKRLGYNRILDKDEIGVIFDNCRYERSWYPEIQSPWCSAFTKDELITLEYHDDLGTFYKSGYGHPYHPLLGCRPLTNMMKHFKNTITTGSAVPKAVNLFSHDTMLNMVYTTLSYGNDHKMLVGVNYDDLLIERKFRPSLDVPFGANLVAVLHECDLKQYQVQFYVNERPMDLDGCDKGLCSWPDLIKLLPNLDNCNLDFCSINA